MRIIDFKEVRKTLQKHSCYVPGDEKGLTDFQEK